jgi:hypothetical protein
VGGVVYTGVRLLSGLVALVVAILAFYLAIIDTESTLGIVSQLPITDENAKAAAKSNIHTVLITCLGSVCGAFIASSAQLKAQWDDVTKDLRVSDIAEAILIQALINAIIVGVIAWLGIRFGTILASGDVTVDNIASAEKTQTAIPAFITGAAYLTAGLASGYKPDGVLARIPGIGEGMQKVLGRGT